jgi:hypothetical protein
VPESRPRKKADYTAPAASRKPARVGGRRWIAPAMCTLWILGLAWIVVFYLAPDLPIMEDIGNWNLVIGMGFIGAGFVFATKWE